MGMRWMVARGSSLTAVNSHPPHPQAYGPNRWTPAGNGVLWATVSSASLSPGSQAGNPPRGGVPRVTT